MKLTRYASGAEFLRHAQAALEREEAANGLIVGIAVRVAEAPDYYGKYPIYLATVDEADELVAAAVRTPPHNVILYSTRGADPDPLRLILDDVLDFHAALPPDSPGRRVPGVVAHAATALAFAELWTRATGQPHKTAMNQRIYELSEVTPPASVPGHLRPARDDELDLLADWYYQFNIDCHLPAMTPVEAREVATRALTNGALFLWEVEGQVVSMAGRGRTSSHGISVGPVYTPVELRGHGYASACVAALSQQLLDAGWDFCTLYTDLDNPISNSIYQRIGYRPVCDSKEYHFVHD
jgi:uncharacterized protein